MINRSFINNSDFYNIYGDHGVAWLAPETVDL